MIPILLTLTLALGQDVDALLRQLGDEDPNVRDAATAALKKQDIESRAIDQKLADLSRSEDPEVVARSTEVLRHRRLIRHFEDPEQFLEELASNDEWIRLTAVKALVRIGKDGVHFLVPLLDGPNDEIHKEVIRGLAEIASPECRKPLRRTLQDATKWQHWEVCLEGLCRLKDEYAREIVFANLREAARDPRTSFSAELENLNSKRASWLIMPAIAAAGGPFRGDESITALTGVFSRGMTISNIIPRRGVVYARTLVVRAVADWKEGREALRPHVMEALRESHPDWMPDVVDVVLLLNPVERAAEFRKLAEDWKYSVTACRVLGRLRDAESIPVLLRIVKYGKVNLERSPPPSKHASLAAAWALGQIASKEAVPSLIELWKLKKREHRATGVHTVLPAIIEVLGRSGDDRALPLLLTALDDPEEEVRFAAARALGRLRARAAVRFLVKRLDDIVGFPLFDDAPEGYADAYWGELSKTGSRRLKSVAVPITRSAATVREAVVGALSEIAETSFEGTPAEQAAAWKKWWAQRKEEYP